MKRTPLAEFLESSGMSQSALAAKVGVTQGAIHQMLKNGRVIYVVTNGRGITLEEVKPIGAAR